MSEPFYVRRLELHTDPRGSLFEMLRFKDEGLEGKGYIYCYTVDPGQRRGDHYHTKKDEWMTCVDGEAVVLIETKDGKRKRVAVRAAEPTLVYFGPYTAHAISNESDKPAVIVSYGSKQFDPKDTDTFPKVIG